MQVVASHGLALNPTRIRFKGMTMATTPCATCRFPMDYEEAICPRCVATCKRQLTAIPELHKLASKAQNLLPGNGGRGSQSGIRTIGLNVDALDFSQGQDLMDILSAWKDYLWEELDLEKDFGRFNKSTASSTYAIPNIVNFLLVHFNQLMKDEELAPVFMKEIRELHNTGLRATGQKEPKHTVIKCPTDLPTGLCKAVLKVDESDMDAKIQCRKCKSIWTVSWLIRVMLSLPDSQYWLDVESIAKYRSGLNARKVRYLAKKWHTPKWAGLYDLGKFIEKFDKEFPHHSTESEQS